MKRHNKNPKYKCTLQTMNEDLDYVYCTAQNKEFTEVQGNHRSSLMSHRHQRRKQATDSLVAVSCFRVSK
jgi:hypothetical protein